MCIPLALTLLPVLMVAQVCDEQIVITGSDYVCENDEVDYVVSIDGPNMSIAPGSITWSIDPPGSGTIVGSTSGTVFTVAWDQGPGMASVIVTLVDYQAGCAGTFDDTLSIAVVDDFGTQLACNDTVQISLGTNCQALVTPDMVLEGGTVMDEDFNVLIEDAQGNIIPGALLTGAHAGMIFEVSVEHICSGNSCWGWLLVEDKIAPTFLDCGFYEIPCDGDPTPGVDVGFPFDTTTATYILNPDGSYTVSGVDSCGDVTLTYVDDVQQNSCPPLVVHIDSIFRTWVVEDQSGNTASCVDTIGVLIGNIDSVMCPLNFDNIDQPALDCRDNFPVDANGNPHPDFSGYPTGASCRNLDYDYVDYRLRQCEGSYKIIREWLIADWCTGRQIYCNQVIKVADTIGPQVSCPPNDTFSVNPFECLGEAIAPNPFDYVIPGGDCSGVNNVQVLVKRGAPDCTPRSAADETTDGVIKLPNGDYRVINLPLGCNWIIYRYTDECGNSTECRYDVFIKEDQKPIAICDQHTTVTLSSKGKALVYATTFDDGSYDNCEVDSFAVRRMQPGDCPSGVADDTQFRSYVEFCCADAANSPIMVVFRVYDKSGNFNECMVEINVVDKNPPTLICPPNISVSCQYTFNSTNVFGTVRDDEADRQNIIINDPANPNVGPNHNWGLDGYYEDDCEASVVYEETDLRNNCGVGTLLRKWTVSDANQSTSCTQRITFFSYSQFNGVGIDWPDDRELYSCPDDVSPDVTGEPVLPNSGNCADLLVTYDDQVYNIVNDACYKILRVWTVVDWCNNNPNNNRWTYTQVIKILNTDAPFFVSGCEDQSFDSPGPQCEGYAELIVEVGDDCTDEEDLEVSYEIDLHKNNIIDYAQSGTNDASNTYPVGTHEICWTVEDNCDNTETCCYDFTIRDRKKPTPYCRSGIVTVVMPSSGEITIWASDLDEGSFDNCTPRGDLRFSFSSNVNDISRTYDCDDLPNGIEETFEVTVYVTDADGNQDFCITTITIQDGIEDVCPDNVNNTTAMLAGNIHTEAAETVEEVMVMLDGNMAGLPKYDMTKNDGHFAFPSIPMSNNYKIEASRNDNPLNGISTLDLVLMQQHLLGISSFNTPYKYIAADVNNTQSLSAGDLAELRKLILGYYADFPENESWRFVPTSHQFTDPTDPWPFAEVLSVDDLKGNMMTNDFVAIKIGDVSGDARANGLVGNVVRSGGELSLSTEDLHMHIGETVDVQLYLPAGDYYGLQYALQLDASALQLVDIKHDNGLTSDANLGLTKLEDGIISLSWNSTNGGVTHLDEAFITLSFDVFKETSLSEVLSLNTKAMVPEAYNELMDVATISLDFLDKEGEVIASSQDFELMQNKPNPFSNSTLIGFNLPRTQEATIKVLDVTGKVVKEMSGMFSKGFNQIEISRYDLQSTGVLYYRLETDDRMATRKMILIE